MEFVAAVCCLAALGSVYWKATTEPDVWIPPQSPPNEIGNIKQYVEDDTDFLNPIRLMVNPHYSIVNYRNIGQFGLPRTIYIGPAARGIVPKYGDFWNHY